MWAPTERNFCGRRTRCVEACPAKALKGNACNPGVPRDEILDVRACDQWKKQHYFIWYILLPQKTRIDTPGVLHHLIAGAIDRRKIS
jgi:NAD-dependent dihydropyrimidine dehydrogenase PreA subunit